MSDTEKSKIIDVFEDSLERIFAGENIEGCLEIYHDYVDELKPLLETVLLVRQKLEIHPSSVYKTRVKEEFLSIAQQKKIRASGNHLAWRSALSGAILAFMVLILFMGSTVVASTGSMPGQVLYPVKLTSEKVWLTLQTDKLAKLEFSAKLANERVNELIYLLGNSNVDNVDIKLIYEASDRLEETLNLVENLASTIHNGADYSETSETATIVSSIQDKNRVRLMRALALYAVTSSDILSQQMQKAPQDVKSALEKAINEMMDSFDRAILAIEQGQLK